jgi:hypothetical protein
MTKSTFFRFYPDGSIEFFDEAANESTGKIPLGQYCVGFTEVSNDGKTLETPNFEICVQEDVNKFSKS